MIPVEIRTPFYGAGAVYGWGKKEPGIGIKRTLVSDALKLDQELRITISNDPIKYKIHPKKVLEIGRKKWVKCNTLLLIIPIKALEVYKPKLKQVPKISPREILREDTIRKAVLKHNI